MRTVLEIAQTGTIIVIGGAALYLVLLLRWMRAELEKARAQLAEPGAQRQRR